MDDPGPGTRSHPMNEYIEVLRAPAVGMNMSHTEIAAIAAATYNTMLELRERLQRKGKFVWLHAADENNARAAGAARWPVRGGADGRCGGGRRGCEQTMQVEKPNTRSRYDH